MDCTEPSLVEGGAQLIERVDPRPIRGAIPQHWGGFDGAMHSLLDRPMHSATSASLPGFNAA